MNDDGVNRLTLLILLAVAVCIITTYVAFVNPPLGVAIAVGVAVAAFVWQMLKNQ